MDLDWPRICITALTVAAFALSAIGLLLIRRDAAAAVGRMENERALRDEFAAELHVITHDENASGESIVTAAELWKKRHEEAGLEPHSSQSVNDGREFLAERIIRELDQGSRVDVVLVGLGLLCGLAASIWGTWLPSA